VAARAALASGLASKDMPIVANVTVVLAEISSGSDPAQAATMLGIAAALRGSEDDTSPQLRQLRGRLLDALGDADFERAFRAGRELDRPGALDHVRRW
jgi:hypothetical protein